MTSVRVRKIATAILVLALWGQLVGSASGDDLNPAVWAERYNKLQLEIANTAKRQELVEARIASGQVRAALLQVKVDDFVRRAYIDGGSVSGEDPLAVGVGEAAGKGPYLAGAIAEKKSLVTELLVQRTKLTVLRDSDATLTRTLEHDRVEVGRVKSWLEADANKRTVAAARSHAELMPVGVVAPDPGAVIAIAFAQAQLGKPYRFATAGPLSYDCSGLTSAAWAAAGVTLAHYSGAQYQQTQRITRSELSPGDLVFLGRGGSQHVALYVGANLVISAPHSGTVVRVQGLYANPSGYGRVKR